MRARPHPRSYQNIIRAGRSRGAFVSRLGPGVGRHLSVRTSGAATGARRPRRCRGLARLDPQYAGAGCTGWESIYGGARSLRLGLELLSTKLTGQSRPADVEIARYVVTLVHLEGSLRRRPAMLDEIRQGIDTARTQMKFFENDAPAEGAHPLLVEKLAQVYSQTISTLTPRILVSGEHGHLTNPAIAAKVRAALLAGIRSAVLWRQLGGRRWQLLFKRSQITRAAAELLAA
jgi:high frequency lysogenization protein